jgi:dTMP kinase
MNTPSGGLLISLEGIDGCGKSTLAGNLSTLLNAHGHPTYLTKEPGGSDLGKQLRTLLQTQPVAMNAYAEYLLFAADRAQHVQEITPHLLAGKCVISDRMADSSIVYQGYGRGLDISMIRSINAWIMRDLQPDITFYLRITTQQARKRIAQRKAESTVFEQEQADFTQRLIDGFDTLFKDAPHVIILDGMLNPSDITQQAYEAIREWINR